MPFTERSEASRSAILVAARRCLASRGYSGTTIRAVAAEAGIDPSMVMRYYGSKKGLFSAAIDVDLGFPDLRGRPRRQLGRLMAEHVVARWEAESTEDGIVLLLRSSATHADAADRLHEIFAQQVAPLVSTLEPDQEIAEVRAAMMATQVLGVALCRYIVRLPPMATMEPEQLVNLIAPVFQHYLTGRLDQRVSAVHPPDADPPAGPQRRRSPRPS